MNKLYLYVCLLVLSTACNTKQNKQEGNEFQYSGDTIHIQADAPANQKMILETVDSAMYRSNFHTAGTVKAIPSQIAEIAAPFDGRITKSFVSLGQKVAAGTPIFELSSNEFYDAAKTYFQAFQNKQLAERNLKRQRDLVSHGVGTQKELEEAEAAYESELKEYESISAHLKVFNVNPEQLTMGQALKVCSPISGEIVQSNMVIGQYIKSDAPPAAIVAELNKVWVVAQVKERQIGLIHPGDDVIIRTDAQPGKLINGSIYHINDLMDEDTRSVQVLIVCNNEKQDLKPGMFANVEFISSPRKMIVIPAKAVFQAEEESYVFKQITPGSFVKQTVIPLTAEDGKVAVAEGLQAGDVIVSDGGIYLETNQ